MDFSLFQLETYTALGWILSKKMFCVVELFELSGHDRQIAVVVMVMLKVVEVMIWLCLENGCGGENKTVMFLWVFSLL